MQQWEAPLLCIWSLTSTAFREFTPRNVRILADCVWLCCGCCLTMLSTTKNTQCHLHMSMEGRLNATGRGNRSSGRKTWPSATVRTTVTLLTQQYTKVFCCTSYNLPLNLFCCTSYNLPLNLSHVILLIHASVIFRTPIQINWNCAVLPAINTPALLQLLRTEQTVRWYSFYQQINELRYSSSHQPNKEQHLHRHSDTDDRRPSEQRHRHDKWHRKTCSLQPCGT
jgi:hypothetical protein